MAFNIKKILVKGVPTFSHKYYDLDGKEKFLRDQKKTKLVAKIIIKRDQVGFTKTTTQEWTLVEAYKLWLNRQKQKEIDYGKPSKSCIRDYDSFYRIHILPFFNNIDVRTLTKINIEDFISHLEKKKSINTKTLRKIFNVLSLILGYSASKDKIERNVCKHKNYLDDIVIEENIPQALDFNEWTQEKVEAIIKNVKDPQIQLMFCIMYETACRPSEARGLAKKNLDFKSNIPFINITNAVKRDKSLGTTKSKAGVRSIAIAYGLRDKIVDHINTLPSDQESLFLNRYGKYICLEVLIKHLDKALKKLGYTLPIKRKTYFFRHYTATTWAKDNKYDTLSDLAKALGDFNETMVKKVYIAPYESKDKEKDKQEYINNKYQYK